MKEPDTSKTRIYYRDGKVEEYADTGLALYVYFGLPRGIKAAFRGANDVRPVYSHDYVDK